jgi:hypothetical protein
VGLSGDVETMWKFVQAEDAVGASLTMIDRTLLDASLSLSQTGIIGPVAGAILENLTVKVPSTIDAVTVDLNGTIQEVAPDEYQYAKGEYIGDQEQIKRLFATRQPVGLSYIKSVEGPYAMDFESPVFDEGGCIAGSVSILINSTDFFDHVLGPYQPGNGSKIWVMQPDGVVIYETDVSQIGLNVFEDPVFLQFPGVQELARRVAEERSGYGTYEFFNQDRSETVKRALYWTTIGYHGTEIRLMLSQDIFS